MIWFRIAGWTKHDFNPRIWARYVQSFISNATNNYLLITDNVVWNRFEKCFGVLHLNLCLPFPLLHNDPGTSDEIFHAGLFFLNSCLGCCFERQKWLFSFMKWHLCVCVCVCVCVCARARARARACMRACVRVYIYVKLVKMCIYEKRNL
jgi:hypothetical protein